MKTRACDIMTQDVVTLDPEMNLTELDRVLLSYGVSGGPVVEDGIVVGVVSRSDVIRALYEEQSEAARVSGFYTSPFPIPIPALERLARDSRRIADRMTKMRVREIMTSDVKSVAPDDPVEVVARMLAAGGYHRVPVLDGGSLVGIVTTLDLVRLLASRGLGEA
jgi:CBS domain-containing protein